MQTFAFVQARMGSTRLPGKVLADVAGTPALTRIVERVQSTAGLDGVAILTSDRAIDDPIRELARGIGVPVVSGSESDVLDRFHRGALELGADLIVRVTADCPLIDAGALGGALALYHATPGVGHVAVASGALAPRPGLRRFPDGLDGEVFSAATLAEAWSEAEDPYEREHVTPFVWRRPERYGLELFEAPEDWGDERWTIDHPADLEFVRAVYERLAPDGDFGVREVLDLLEREPELRAINARERETSRPVR
jgi:spore coat polysaccharide biosynthesis protein SpsF (cytidylyltransferase family)